MGGSASAGVAGSPRRLFGAVLLTSTALVEGFLPAIGRLDGRLDGRLLALIVFLGIPGGALAFVLSAQPAELIRRQATLTTHRERPHRVG